MSYTKTTCSAAHLLLVSLDSLQHAPDLPPPIAGSSSLPQPGRASLLFLSRSLSLSAR